MNFPFFDYCYDVGTGFAGRQTGVNELKTLDRHTLRQFLIWVAWAAMAFLVLFYVIDIIENLDKFIDRGASFGDVLLYYLTYLPYVTVLISPIVMLLAADFSCGQMSKHREVVAVRSGGISSLRIGVPILAFGLLWSFVMMGFAELIVPYTNRVREEVKDERINKSNKSDLGRIKKLLYQTDDGRVISMEILDPKRERAHEVLVISYDDEDAVKELLRARRMEYDGEKWELKDGHSYKLSTDSASAYMKFDTKKLRLDISPQELAQRRANPDEMGFFELKDFIERVEKAGGDPTREKTDLYMKLSYPFINFVILLFGVPLVLRFRRGGLVVGFAQSITIAFIYFGAIKVGQVLGYNGNISPLLAAVLGNIIFGTAGFVLLFVHRD